MGHEANPTCRDVFSATSITNGASSASFSACTNSVGKVMLIVAIVRGSLPRTGADLVAKELPGDDEVAAYVSDILVDFVHVHNLYRIRNCRGKRLEEVGDAGGIKPDPGRAIVRP